MITLAERDATIPSCSFECIAVASPCRCMVDLSYANIPSPELALNTQLLNLADVKLPATVAPYSLLENSHRVATRIVSEVESYINNAALPHNFNATLNNSTFASLICIP